MICQTCNAENLASAVFCGGCGERLPDHEGVSPTIRELPPQYEQATKYEPTSETEPTVSTISVEPKDLGTLLTESLTIYRQRFIPFFLIAFIPQLPFILLSITSPESISNFQLFISNAVGNTETATTESTSLPGLLLPLILTASLLELLAFSITLVLVAQHLVVGKIDVLLALSLSVKKILYLIILLIIIVAALIIPVLLIALLVGIPILVYVSTKLFFAFPVMMLENKDPLGAISRSWKLVEKQWWKAFTTSISFFIIFIILSTLISVILQSMLPGTNGAIGATIPAILNSLLTPFVYTGFVLIYFDLRSRKEGTHINITA